MSPLIALHATHRKCRDSIRQHGLLPSRPTIPQPFGVYVYGDDFGHAVFSRGPLCCCEWSSALSDDVWRVAYIGPVMPDRFVRNGLVLPERIPPEHITLVTGNK